MEHTYRNNGFICNITETRDGLYDVYRGKITQEDDKGMSFQILGHGFCRNKLAAISYGEKSVDEMAVSNG